MKTSIKFLFLLLFLFSFQIKLYSQGDSLKGFELFKFGDTKDECINILNAFLISYDTLCLDTSLYNDTNQFIMYMKEMIKVTTLSSVNYYDTIKLSDRYFARKISLFFDRVNNFRLFSIEIKIDEPCVTVDSSNLYASEIFKKITGKYGSSYDTSSITLWYPPTKTCTWNFKDGYIKAAYDTHTFYDYDIVDIAKIITVENGKFKFNMYYTDLTNSAIFISNMELEIEKLKEKFLKNIKK